MASPQSNATSAASGATPALIWRHMAEALLLERAAERLIPRSLRSLLDDIQREALGEWGRQFRSPHAQVSGPPFILYMSNLSSRLATIQFNPTAQLLAQSHKALALGVKQGLLESGHTGTVDAQLSNDINIYVTQVNAEIQRRLAAAVQGTGNYTKGSFAAAQRAITPARQAANIAAAAARTVVNEQINQGLGEVAKASGRYKLWVAEPDACVTCLALSGTVVESEEVFPVDATFGSRAIRWVPGDGLDGPPRHPNCRCRLTPWIGDENDPTSLPAALRREAERSILLGRGPASESEGVKTTAAKRLLDRIDDGIAPSGWKVPKSVQRKSRAISPSHRPFRK